jgi:hypothetical protein
VKYDGAPALAIFFFLVSFSIPWMRAKFYEIFVHSHIYAAIVYLGVIFWHAGNLGDSVCITLALSPSSSRSAD